MSAPDRSCAFKKVNGFINPPSHRWTSVSVGYYTAYFLDPVSLCVFLYVFIFVFLSDFVSLFLVSLYLPLSVSASAALCLSVFCLSVCLSLNEVLSITASRV